MYVCGMSMNETLFSHRNGKLPDSDLKFSYGAIFLALDVLCVCKMIWNRQAKRDRQLVKIRHDELVDLINFSCTNYTYQYIKRYGDRKTERKSERSGMAWSHLIFDIFKYTQWFRTRDEKKFRPQSCCRHLVLMDFFSSLVLSFSDVALRPHEKDMKLMWFMFFFFVGFKWINLL